MSRPATGVAAGGSPPSADAEDPAADSAWPRRLLELATQPPVAPEVVVPDSTPVVSFGDPSTAAVATLGINPSPRQFVRQNGSLREGPERRLATLPWLGLRSWDELDDVAGDRILAECARYFRPGRVPYRRWFDPFDRVLVEGLGVSYYDGRACHLNLVPWATQPVWGRLDRQAWRRLEEAARPFLVEQLRTAGYRLVVVNGRTVMDELQRSGVVEWSDDGKLDGPPSARLHLGESARTLFAGWTCNLQNQPGAARLAGGLAAWLRRLEAGSGRSAVRRQRLTPGASAEGPATTANC